MTCRFKSDGTAGVTRNVKKFFSLPLRLNVSTKKSSRQKLAGFFLRNVL